MNKVILMGRLTKDPAISMTQSQNPMKYARYTLAVDRRTKQDGNQNADFISCIAFGKNADFVENTCIREQGLLYAAGSRLEAIPTRMVRKSIRLMWWQKNTILQNPKAMVRETTRTSHRIITMDSHRIVTTDSHRVDSRLTHRVRALTTQLDSRRIISSRRTTRHMVMEDS